jgi:hypothetical protein
VLLSFRWRKACHALCESSGLEQKAAMTWQDFLTQCRTIKGRRAGIALSVDCSTISMI